MAVPLTDVAAQLLDTHAELTNLRRGLAFLDDAHAPKLRAAALKAAAQAAFQLEVVAKQIASLAQDDDDKSAYALAQFMITKAEKGTI